MHGNESTSTTARTGNMRSRTTDHPEAAPSAGQLIAALAAQLRARFHGDCPAIAAALQWPASAVRTLMRGGMSNRWRLLFSISKVALALGRTRDAVAEELARSFIPSSCVIGRVLARAIATHGVPLAVVLKQLHLSEAAVIRLLLGRTLVGLSATTRAALARFLELPDLDVQQLIQESLTRRRMPTRELDLVGPVRSLAEALHDAFDREGLTQTEWVDPLSIAAGDALTVGVQSPDAALAAATIVPASGNQFLVTVPALDVAGGPLQTLTLIVTDLSTHQSDVQLILLVVGPPGGTT
jgi:hypothetical protein